MKKFIPVFALSLLTSFLSFAETDLPHITVYGTAEEMVVPDELKWTITINTTGASIEEVATNHLKDVSTVLDYLKGCVPEKEIKTAHMQLNENWVYRNQSALKEGYYAFTTINFKSTDFAKYMNYWMQLSKFNNVRINQVSFDVSNRKEIQNRVRLKAVAVAKEKATALATSLGVALLEPLAVEEASNSDNNRRSGVGGVSFAQEPSGNSISPGTQSVESNVKLVFRISAK
jgi:uncharacterized protein YggE